MYRQPQEHWQQYWGKVLPEHNKHLAEDIDKKGYVDNLIKPVQESLTQLQKDHPEMFNGFDIKEHVDQIKPKLDALAKHARDLKDSRKTVLEPKRAEHRWAMEPAENPADAQVIALFREFNDIVGEEYVENLIENGNDDVLKAIEHSRFGHDGRSHAISSITLKDILSGDKSNFKTRAQEKGAKLTNDFASSIWDNIPRVINVDANDDTSLNVAPVRNLWELLVLIDAFDTHKNTATFDAKAYFYDQEAYVEARAGTLGDIYTAMIKNFDLPVDMSANKKEIAKQAGLTIPLAATVKNIYGKLERKGYMPRKQTVGYTLMMRTKPDYTDAFTKDTPSADDVLETHLLPKLDERGRELVTTMYHRTLRAIDREEDALLREEYNDIIQNLRVAADYAQGSTEISTATGLPEAAAEFLKEGYDVLEIDGANFRPYTIDDEGNYTDQTTGLQILISEYDWADEFFNEHLSTGLTDDGRAIVRALYDQTLDNARMEEIAKHERYSGTLIRPLLEDETDAANQAKLDALKTRAGTAAQEMLNITLYGEREYLKGRELGL